MATLLLVLLKMVKKHFDIFCNKIMKDSLPWIMNPGTMRWNFDPRKPSPDLRSASVTKFSTVFGTTSPKRPRLTIRSALFYEVFNKLLSQFSLYCHKSRNQSLNGHFFMKLSEFYGYYVVTLTYSSDNLVPNSNFKIHIIWNFFLNTIFMTTHFYQSP